MPREESDREDLMREATALNPRVELQLEESGNEVTLVAGRRRDGGFSIYFGADPVYHFDDQGRLRRAFVADRLYRSQGTTLARLTRQRTKEEVQLLRHDLEPKELAKFLEGMCSQLRDLQSALVERRFRTMEQFPSDTDFGSELPDRITQILAADPPFTRALKK